MRSHNSITSKLSVVFHITKNTRKMCCHATRPCIIRYAVECETSLQQPPSPATPPHWISFSSWHRSTFYSVCSWHCCLECTFPTFYVTSNFTSFRVQLKCQPPWIALAILLQYLKLCFHHSHYYNWQLFLFTTYLFVTWMYSWNEGIIGTQAMSMFSTVPMRALFIPAIQ